MVRNHIYWLWKWTCSWTHDLTDVRQSFAAISQNHLTFHHLLPQCQISNQTLDLTVFYCIDKISSSLLPVCSSDESRGVFLLARYWQRALLPTHWVLAKASAAGIDLLAIHHNPNSVFSVQAFKETAITIRVLRVVSLDGTKTNNTQKRKRIIISLQSVGDCGSYRHSSTISLMWLLHLYVMNRVPRGVCYWI